MNIDRAELVATLRGAGAAMPELYADSVLHLIATRDGCEGMSSVRIEHGSAAVELAAVAETRQRDGVHPRYDPRDLMDATATALLAVNTPQAADWASALYRLTSTTDTRPREA